MGLGRLDGFPPPSSRGQALRGNNGRGGGRAVREPPLRVVSKVGLNSKMAVYFHSNDRLGERRMTGNDGVSALEWMDLG